MSASSVRTNPPIFNRLYILFFVFPLTHKKNSVVKGFVCLLSHHLAQLDASSLSRSLSGPSSHTGDFAPREVWSLSLSLFLFRIHAPRKACCRSMTQKKYDADVCPLFFPDRRVGWELGSLFCKLARAPAFSSSTPTKPLELFTHARAFEGQAAVKCARGANVCVIKKARAHLIFCVLVISQQPKRQQDMATGYGPRGKKRATNPRLCSVGGCARERARHGAAERGVHCHPHAGKQ